MIHIYNLQKVIEKQTVLDIATLVVQPGEIAAVIGTAGSGREVLFDLLTGRMRPTVGKIQLDEIDPGVNPDAFSRKTGVLFAEDGIYSRQSVEENLRFFCRLYGLPAGRVAETLEEVGLADHARHMAEKLSTGLKRRLAFGRAILHQPENLILFEPFERCDALSILLIKRLLRQFAGTGIAILLLTHDQTHLEGMCDVVHKLENGRIVESSRPGEAEQAAQPFKIPVRLEGKVALVNPADILYAEAREGRANLYTAEGTLTTQFTLAELESRLVRSGFFRTHRSYLVNLQHVKEVIPYTRDSFSLRLDDAAATVIPLSKQAAGELKELLGY